MIPNAEQNRKESPLIPQRKPLSGISNVTSISVGRQSGYTVLSIFLCSTYLLLPIERGFPVIRFFGFPFTLTILVTIAIFITLVIFFRGHILIPGPYTFFQAFFVFTLFIAAMISHDVPAGMFVVLSYTVTFILNHVILFHLFANGFRRQFTIILCVITIIAAVLCILEGLFHFYLPFYVNIFQSFNYEAMSYQLTRNDFRAVGVLGNPIVSSLALSLAIPFIMDLRHNVKFVVLALVIIASVLTATRTILLFWSVTALYLATRSKRTFVAVSSLTLFFVLVFLILPDDLRSNIINPIAMYLNRDDLSNVYFRQSLLESGINHFLSQRNVLVLLFGEGLKSTSIDALSFGNRTLENVFVTVLLEAGLFGLGVILIDYFSIALIGSGRRTMHWYNVIAWMIAGLSIVTIYYATFNLIWVASIAVLECEAQNAQKMTWKPTSREV